MHAFSAATSAAQESAAKPRVQRVQPPEDPLAPWPLEAVASQPGEPGPSGPQPEAAADSTLSLPDEVGAIPAPVDSSEIVLVVQLRQILVSDPERAPLLGRMLQSGMTLEEAKQTLGITDVDERRREYALDELAAEVQAEIEALPDSAWSSPRRWRGRTAYFQILAREERGRGTVPALGENLGPEERNRLVSTLPAKQQPKLAQPALDANLTPASVTEQVPAEYPPTATESGEVTLVVDVGRLGEVQNVRVESSTDRIFEEPAIEAARESTYRAADRDGFPEPGTVRLTYKFAAPQSPDATEGTAPEP
jgi:TonB family protein